MPKLSIPINFEQAFELLMSLSKDKTHKIFKCAGEIDGEITSDQSLSEISKKTGVKASDLDVLFKLFFNLINIIEGSTKTVDELVNDITETLKEREIKFSKKLQENLKIILNDKTSDYYLKVKSHFLANENDQIFLDSKILSDIRPIFSNSLEESFSGVIVFHSLKIRYGKDGQTHESFFQLNNDDLLKLKNQIIRAENKEKLIKEKLNKSEIKFFKI